MPAGTVIAATIRNQLADSTLRIYGLVTRPAAAHDSLVIPPGESRLVTFPAGVPGSYLYWASLGATKLERDEEREQIAGAFVVDPAGGSPPDRILVLNIWGTSGYGFDLRVRPAAVPVIAALLFGVEVAFSRIWLARYRLGPAEWLWRVITYGKPQPMR